MCAVNVETEPQIAGTGHMVVNDFSIIAATVNGSGSQTANNTLVRALFKMGIPVNGKNLFPSNIQGLPTWFNIRASKDGYIARRDDYHILIAMNIATQAEDIQKLAPGGMVIYPLEWVDDRKIKFTETRPDIHYYGVPVAQFAKESGADAALRDYVANMAYVGAVSTLLGIELPEIHSALEYHFSGKKKAVDLNWGVVEKAAAYTQEKYGVSPNFRVERMNSTAGKFLIEGNAAGALGAVFGGVTVAAWYPITPATSFADNLKDYATELRYDAETKTTTLAIVQAEDELAAIGMVLGAGWMGARAVTSTSGPGISLMSEFAGMSYFAEIPAVIWDIQRMGPSTGLPTRVSQGDVLKAYFLGHGDSRHVVLLPCNMKECFEFGWRAHDLADRLQTLIFVLSDLDLGMNLWMTDPFEYPDQPIDHGKVKTWDDIKTNGGFARYKDVDGDGIGYRTFPGQGPAYFTRGTGHTEAATYSERPDDWEKNLQRLERKHNTARKIAPQPVEKLTDGSEIGVISYGSTDAGMQEAFDLLAAKGVKLDYQRVRALPLGEKTRDFVANHKRIYVVENNYSGQMAEMLSIDYPDMAPKLISIAKCDGLPLTARWITDTITAKEL
ncbi:MAG: 2-oxoacid:acceptor oxidoreductase subunit alpha [Anaerolineae bacterium]